MQSKPQNDMVIWRPAGETWRIEIILNDPDVDKCIDRMDKLLQHLKGERDDMKRMETDNEYAQEKMGVLKQ